METQSALSAFLKATEAGLGDARIDVKDFATQTMIEAILAKLPHQPEIKRPQDYAESAVCQHNNEALKMCTSYPDLASALRTLEPHCCWQQNPNYNADNQSPEFVNGQAYQAYLGPEGLADADGLAIFAMLMAPGVHYKEHAHPAEELYFVLSGHAEWLSGGDNGGDWLEKGPGSLIHHPGGIIHATRTTTTPLLCLAFWLGNVEQRAKTV